MVSAIEIPVPIFWGWGGVWGTLLWRHSFCWGREYVSMHSVWGFRLPVLGSYVLLQGSYLPQWDSNALDIRS